MFYVYGKSPSHLQAYNIYTYGLFEFDCFDMNNPKPVTFKVLKQLIFRNTPPVRFSTEAIMPFSDDVPTPDNLDMVVYAFQKPVSNKTSSLVDSTYKGTDYYSEVYIVMNIKCFDGTNKEYGAECGLFNHIN